MRTFTITLPDEIAAVVDRAIASGGFRDADHVMMYAVAQVDDELRGDEHVDKEWLREQIRIGRESGPSAPLDTDEIWQEVEQQLDAEEAARAGSQAQPASPSGHPGATAPVRPVQPPSGDPVAR